MSISVGAFLLMVCSVMTGLITEALKKVFNSKNPNVTASIVSVVVGGAITFGYMVNKGIAIDANAIMYVISEIVLSWLCAMLGYDKVAQALSAMRG